MSKLLVTFLTVCLLLPPVVRAGEEEVSLAVMEFASKGGVSQKQMDALSDLLANEIRQLGNFRVIGKEDIRAALDIESQKNLVGCSDASCVAEIGGALGVRWVVVGNVSQFGETYLLNLKLMDVAKIRVAKGLSKKVEGGEAKLIDALSQAARELIAGAIDQLAPGSAPPEVKPQEKVAEAGPEEKPAEKPPEPPPPPPPGVQASAEGGSNTWAHVTFWSGLGLAVLGGVCMGMAINSADDYYKEGLNVDDRLSAAEDARSWTGAMWLGLGSGVALMTTGLLMWLLEDDSGTSAAAAPTLDGQGVVFSIGGSF